MVVERISGQKTYFTIDKVGEEGILNLASSSDLEADSKLQIVDVGGTYNLIANIGDNQFDITAKRKKKSDYFLLSRGFNWVNEYPLNR